MDKDEYLNMLPEDEKLFFSMFYKRFHYLTSLTNMNLDCATGNYNSDICIIVNNYKDKIKCVKFIKSFLFNDVNISLWNVYTTCRIKDETLSEKEYDQMLMCELSAVQPKIIFYFTNDKESFSTEKKSDTEYVYINVKDVDYITDDSNKEEKQYKTFIKKLRSYLLKLVLLRDIE